MSAAAAAARPPHARSWPPPAAQTSRQAARPRLLLVDDDPRTLDTVPLLLRAAGMDADVVVAHCGREALALGRCHDVDLLIVDLRLPDVDGLDVVEALGDEGRRVPFLVHTAYSTTEIDVVAPAEGQGLAPTVDDHHLRVHSAGAQQETYRVARAGIVVDEQQARAGGSSRGLRRWRRPRARVVRPCGNHRHRWRSGTHRPSPPGWRAGARRTA